MSATPPTKDQEAVRAVLRRINDAWLTGHFDDLGQYFHENMVVVPPGYHMRLNGRDACVRSYRDFTAAATIDEFMLHDPSVEVVGDTATAMSRFDTVYRLEGKTYRESGFDLFVLNRTGDDWLAVFRTVIQLADGD